MGKRSILAIACLAIGIVLVVSPSALAISHADAAKRIGEKLNIPMTSDRALLYGLFPLTFPGGYDGVEDVSYPDRNATLEEIVVTLVRWAGWDTVRYDLVLAETVRPYVLEKGFPYYAPDPTPRAIPNVVVALEKGLIRKSDLPRLREEVSPQEIDELAARARELEARPPVVPKVPADLRAVPKLTLPTGDPGLLLLSPGFTDYKSLKGRQSTVVDMSAPNLRIFNPGSRLSGGKQDYFPLGTLHSTLSVGVFTDKNSYSHQSEAIYGVAENSSPTVNAVGIWGAATSLAEKSRVWAGFFSAETSKGADKDAQIVGLEVDALNYAKPGESPNASKNGIQVVGIGTASLTNAIEIIGAGPGKWGNGISFAPDAITPDGAYIGATATTPVARGIDFQGVKFNDGALLIGQQSAITFANKSGEKSAILTDDSNRLLIRAGESGLRVIDSTSERDLLTVKGDGDLVGSYGSMNEMRAEVDKLHADVAGLSRPSLRRFLLPAALLLSTALNVLAGWAVWRMARGKRVPGARGGRQECDA